MINHLSTQEEQERIRAVLVSGALLCNDAVFQILQSFMAIIIAIVSIVIGSFDIIIGFLTIFKGFLLIARFLLEQDQKKEKERRAFA